MSEADIRTGLMLLGRVVHAMGKLLLEALKADDHYSDIVKRASEQGILQNVFYSHS